MVMINYSSLCHNNGVVPYRTQIGHGLPNETAPRNWYDRIIGVAMNTSRVNGPGGLRHGSEVRLMEQSSIGVYGDMIRIVRYESRRLSR